MGVFVISATLEAVDEVAGKVAAIIGRGTDDAGKALREIALVEALNNIVHHAYGDSSTGTIQIEVLCFENETQVKLRDFGRPAPYGLFSVRTSAPAGMVDAAEPAESGRGIGLILACTSAVSITRDDNSNVLTMHFAEDEKWQPAGF